MMGIDDWENMSDFEKENYHRVARAKLMEELEKEERIKRIDTWFLVILGVTALLSFLWSV